MKIETVEFTAKDMKVSSHDKHYFELCWELTDADGDRAQLEGVEIGKIVSPITGKSYKFSVGKVFAKTSGEVCVRVYPEMHINANGKLAPVEA